MEIALSFSIGALFIVFLVIAGFFEKRDCDEMKLTCSVKLSQRFDAVTRVNVTLSPG